MNRMWRERAGGLFHSYRTIPVNLWVITGKADKFDCTRTLS